ncbi:glycosyltransferase family 2 protein [Chitinivibrio alkaliphilus]|uniref:Glycosyl transferase family 2 protein n=1 Tax=Chitinivibrio alkaliphilus ACht1 TaxID=1313304 RepID=U7D9K3_9BACT|nr:glycosyltransferase family 2 protein [Chitinivibrio alkaliphilus]ERP31095.1 glycosyl transferase family 2 protein [Chitinivibrio alkaliphilus ACht1]
MRTPIVIGIITYNRPRGLAALVESIARQQFDRKELSVSLIIVDNACNPNTEKQVYTLLEEHSLQGIYSTEEEQGIPYARNKVVELFLRETSGKWLAFIDDDQTVAPSWVASLVETAEETSAQVVYNRQEYVLPPGSPEWWKKSFFFQKKEVHGAKIAYFYTHGVLIHRTVFEHFPYPFDICLKKSGGSDSRFAAQVHRAGFIIVYSHTACSYEHVPASRLTYKWLYKRGLRAGALSSATGILTGKHPWYMRAKCVLRFFCWTGRAVGGILFSTLIQKKGQQARAVYELGWAVGIVMGLFGFLHDEYTTIHGE